MDSRFTHDATLVAYLMLASITIGLLAGHHVWGAVGLGAVASSIAVIIRQRLRR